MAYIKRDKYTVPDNNYTKELLLEALCNNGVKGSKARQLVYYPTPMSLIRWGKYLKPSEIEEYLVPFEDDGENEEFDDIGI